MLMKIITIIPNQMVIIKHHKPLKIIPDTNEARQPSKDLTETFIIIDKHLSLSALSKENPELSLTYALLPVRPRLFRCS